MQQQDAIHSSCFHRELIRKLKKEARECGEEIVVSVQGGVFVEDSLFIVHVTWDTDDALLLKSWDDSQCVWRQVSHIGPCRSASSVFGYSV